ncbi:hypothetical protein ES703_115323 [subsurface metagenome]
MTGLEGCIRHWESTLSHQRYLLESSTIVLLELTIKFLKELQKRKEEDVKPKSQ